MNIHAMPQCCLTTRGCVCAFVQAVVGEAYNPSAQVAQVEVTIFTACVAAPCDFFHLAWQAGGRRESLVGMLLRRLQSDAVAREGVRRAGLVLDVLPEKPLRCTNFAA